MMRQSPEPCNQAQGEESPLLPGQSSIVVRYPLRLVGANGDTKNMVLATYRFLVVRPSV